MNIANSVTLFRVLLSPLFVVLFLQEARAFEIAALAVVVVAEASDLLDGYLARRYHIVTSFGKLMDPFADNIFRFTAFLCFLARGYAPLWMVVVIFYRDVSVLTLRVFGVLANVVIAARTSGKIKAVVQGTVLNIIIAVIVVSRFTETPAARVREVAWWLMLAATIVTVWSGVDYLLGNWHIVRHYRKW